MWKVILSVVTVLLVAAYSPPAQSHPRGYYHCHPWDGRCHVGMWSRPQFGWDKMVGTMGHRRYDYGHRYGGYGGYGHRYDGDRPRYRAPVIVIQPQFGGGGRRDGAEGAARRRR